jgi:hypothetical protein
MVTEDDVYVFTVINCLGNSDFIIEVGGVNKPVLLIAPRIIIMHTAAAMHS